MRSHRAHLEWSSGLARGQTDNQNRCVWKKSVLRNLVTLSSVACLMSSAAPALAQRVIFGTSVSGTGNLGSWADAGAQTGLAAGDAICQARATAAGLANPQNFVAWLSDSSNDAYCRIHGLAGTKAANCGQPSLPAAAGPWVRTDGFPFGEEITQLLSPNGVVYAPFRLDEFGDPLPEPPTLSVAPHLFFTATSRAGVLPASSVECGNWLNASNEYPAMGTSYHTTSGWTEAASITCSEQARLVCMERLPGPALPSVAVPGRLAFVTSAQGNGNLGSWPEADPGTSGLAAGDSICRNLAADAGFAEFDTFKAWLSDSSTTNAINRITVEGRWVRPDGGVVAASKADLTDGLLRTSINVTDEGVYLGNANVWTGATDLGVAHPDHCDDWTADTSAFTGRNGAADSAGFGWSGGRPSVGAPGGAPRPCDGTSYHLYCLSDADVSIFTDGFEFGDTSAWSSSVP